MSSSSRLLSKAERLFRADSQLKNLPWSKWSNPASAEAVGKAVKSLQARGHKVTIVKSRDDALKTLIAAIPEGKSIYNTGSTTLEEVGFVDFLIKNPTKWDNLKAKVLAAPKAEQSSIRRKAFIADYWISSVNAISEQGDITAVDLTGTRTPGFLSADKVVILAGSNKIVKTYEDGVERIRTFSLPLESARVRDEYKLPGSAIGSMVSIHEIAMVPKERIHVILVDGEALGY